MAEHKYSTFFLHQNCTVAVCVIALTAYPSAVNKLIMQLYQLATIMSIMRSVKHSVLDLAL